MSKQAIDGARGVIFKLDPADDTPTARMKDRREVEEHLAYYRATAMDCEYKLGYIDALLWALGREGE